jgi:hypothetical protein
MLHCLAPFPLKKLLQKNSMTARMNRFENEDYETKTQINYNEGPFS